MKTLIFMVLAAFALSAHAGTLCSAFHIGAPGAVDGRDDNRAVVVDLAPTAVNPGDLIVVSQNGSARVVSAGEQPETSDAVLAVGGNNSDSVYLEPRSAGAALARVESAGINGVTAVLANSVSVTCAIKK